MMITINNGERLAVEFGDYVGEAGVIADRNGVTMVAFPSQKGPNHYTGEGTISGDPWRIVKAERGTAPFIRLTVEPIQ